jgi:hypothetical protein
MAALLRIYTESKLKLPPIILTVRDFNSPVMHALRVRSEVPTLYMHPVLDFKIRPVLERIARAENFNLRIVAGILDTFSGDIRGAMTELRMRGGHARRFVAPAVDAALLITVYPHCILDSVMRGVELFLYATSGQSCRTTKSAGQQRGTFVLSGIDPTLARRACVDAVITARDSRLAVWNDVLNKYVSFLTSNVKAEYRWMDFPVSSLTQGLTCCSSMDKEILVGVVDSHMRKLDGNEDGLSAVLRDVADFRGRIGEASDVTVSVTNYKLSYGLTLSHAHMRRAESSDSSASSMYAKDVVPDSPFIAARQLMDVRTLTCVDAQLHHVDKRLCVSGSGVLSDARPEFLKGAVREDLEHQMTVYNAYDMTPWLMWLNGYNGLPQSATAALPAIADCWSSGDFGKKYMKENAVSAEAASIVTLGTMRMERKRCHAEVPTTRSLNVSRNERMKPAGGALAMASLRNDCLELGMHTNLQMVDAFDLMRLKAKEKFTHEKQLGLCHPVSLSSLQGLMACMESPASSRAVIMQQASACLSDVKMTDDFTLFIDIAAHYGDAWLDESAECAGAARDIAQLGVKLLNTDPPYVPDCLPRTCTLQDLAAAKKDAAYARLGFKRKNLDLFLPFPI